ncbi:unnamed protein product [Rhizoctonia solani]|uniref:Deoxyhypusine hydroxylase n=1 Tax=Rhizoctonia solani TaxID=456999 RepID=A0A8H3HTE7_9AGAM|nr:unnamed protein product [Rhizoctonia solani]
MPAATPESFTKLEATLLNHSGDVPLHARFRSLFTLKALPGQQSIDIISKGFKDDSALLKHELAYVLGQMGDPYAIPTLSNVLSNEGEDPMVRHEAAEALGALSAESAIPLLEKYLTCPERAVRETCEIALDKIKWDATPEGKASNKLAKERKEQGAAQFTSVDPAPAAAHSKLVSSRNTESLGPNAINELRNLLLDTSKPLFERYRAMFALRDIGTAEAVDALAAGLSDSSALFKHEVAFVFGQLLSPHSVPALVKTLEDVNENEMVRHEAAEALGGIATPEVLPVLRPNTVNELRDTLLDTSRPLFERYRAMFALRDIGTAEAVDALAAGLSDSSALFKHEVAFVFGQLLSPHSVPALVKTLEDVNEDEMVRHEAAEALGGIATPEVLPVLREWASKPDVPRVVRESCVVALDMYEYENSGQFQYADGLSSQPTAAVGA